MISLLHSRGVFPRRKRILVEMLSKLLSSPAEVLDVGSGDGSIALAIQNRAKDLRFHCIDVLVRPDVALPVQKYDGVTFPVTDSSKDYVLFVDVLHHTPDPQILLNEAARVTRKYIVIKDHNANGLCSRATLRFMDWVGNARFGVSLPYNYWTHQQWQEGYKTAGLKVVSQIDTLGLYPSWSNWLFGRRLHFIVLLEKI